ncbi:MAG: hypothetical protein VCC19_15420, partial [Myxococcota bacterium]
MQKLASGIATLALALFLSPTGVALAGDENVDTSATITFGEDTNQGRGVQVNADEWEDIPNALAGSGAQSIDAGGSSNTGTGTQDNTSSFQDEWYNIDNANSDSGAQVLGSDNSNGGDRISNDQVLGAGDGSLVANAALEAAVSGNAVAVAGENGGAKSAVGIYRGSDFNGLSGVSAVAIGSGMNA